MSIPLPNLDDRTYSDLVDEMRALIPRYAPAWTDHNASDPGIMLLELFSWLTEALIYRLNRIPEDSTARMLELLGATFHLACPAVVKLKVSAVGLKEELLVPVKTPLLAKSVKRGVSIPFETLADLRLTPGQGKGKLKACQTVPVCDEYLGKGDDKGSKYQVFSLPGLAATGSFLAGWPFEPGLGRPLISSLKVGGKAWTYKPGLLDLQLRDYTVESRLGLICFGNGTQGLVPQTGHKVVACYRRTLGARGNPPDDAEFEIDKRSPHLDDALKKALDDVDSISFKRCPPPPDPTRRAVHEVRGLDPDGLRGARDQVRTELKTHWRMITQEDFEQLLPKERDLRVARAKCLPERDLTAPLPDARRVGHISVIIVPKQQDKTDRPPIPSKECLKAVYKFLDKRRLITCRHHVVGPSYTGVQIGARVHRILRVPEQTVMDSIEQGLKDFFHPLTGGPGPECCGWPFGRDVYASEVYKVLEDVEGVDHVDSLTLYTLKDDVTWTLVGDHWIVDDDDWIAVDEDWIAVDHDNLVHFDFDPSRIKLHLVR